MALLTRIDVDTSYRRISLSYQPCEDGLYKQLEYTVADRDAPLVHIGTFIDPAIVFMSTNSRRQDRVFCLLEVSTLLSFDLLSESRLVLVFVLAGSVLIKEEINCCSKNSHSKMPCLLRGFNRGRRLLSEFNSNVKHLQNLMNRDDAKSWRLSLGRNRMTWAVANELDGLMESGKQRKGPFALLRQYFPNSTLHIQSAKMTEGMEVFTVFYQHIHDKELSPADKRRFEGYISNDLARKFRGHLARTLYFRRVPEIRFHRVSNILSQASTTRRTTRSIPLING